MNDRIKELYAQASEYACNQLGHSNQHAGKTLAEVANEKFAQLIINECIAVCMEQRDPSNLNYKPSVRMVEAIRQHFGLD